MKDQKIFRLSGFGNLSAIATVLEDGKCWVRYYNGIEVIEALSSECIESKFILSVEKVIIWWCKENDYHLWSY
jgi:hypothetical protein